MATENSCTDSYPHFGTLATHAGQEPEQWKSLAVVPPISLSTTFKQITPGKPVRLNLLWWVCAGLESEREILERIKKGRGGL